MHKNSATQKLSMQNPVHLLATGFGSGLINPAPGTWGTLFGLISGIIILNFLSPYFFMGLICVSFIVGCYICGKTADDMQIHDHGCIVWDEIVAIWLVLCWLPEANIYWYLVGFVLFRLFDIVKPQPIKLLDQHVTGGFGIMLDDILAAGYTLGCMYLYLLLINLY